MPVSIAPCRFPFLGNTLPFTSADSGLYLEEIQFCYIFKLSPPLTFVEFSTSGIWIIQRSLCAPYQYLSLTARTSELCPSVQSDYFQCHLYVSNSTPSLVHTFLIYFLSCSEVVSVLISLFLLHCTVSLFCNFFFFFFWPSNNSLLNSVN